MRRAPSEPEFLPELPPKRRSKPPPPQSSPWNSRVAPEDRAIPHYNALADGNCAYVRSQAFRKHYRSYLDLKSDERAMKAKSLATRSLSMTDVQAASAAHLPAAGMGGMPSLEVATVRDAPSRTLATVHHAPSPRPSPPKTKNTTPPREPCRSLAQLKAIDEREHYVNRLHSLLTRAPLDPPPLLLDQIRAELADTLASLRLASVNAVEAIGRWQRRRPHLEAFVWRSHNYELKMLVDLFFLGLAPTVADAISDPFLLRCFAEPPPHSRSTASLPPLADGTAAKRLLALWFAPSRRHTKHHLVRMWAAEKVIGQERDGWGFDPVAPTLEKQDVLLRAKAAYFFYGKKPDDAAQQLQLLYNTAPRDESQPDDAAVRLQASFRGHEARKEAATIRSGGTVPAPKPRPVQSRPPPQPQPQAPPPPPPQAAYPRSSESLEVRAKIDLERGGVRVHLGFED